MNEIEKLESLTSSLIEVASNTKAKNITALVRYMLPRWERDLFPLLAFSRNANSLICENILKPAGYEISDKRLANIIWRINEQRRKAGEFVPMGKVALAQAVPPAPVLKSLKAPIDVDMVKPQAGNSKNNITLDTSPIVWNIENTRLKEESINDFENEITSKDMAMYNHFNKIRERLILDNMLGMNGTRILDEIQAPTEKECFTRLRQKFQTHDMAF
ncbi:hypothetical protein LA345_23450 [Burkholderia vietnamiensis]|nr:hypothetical protein [Burkholderia vietnamiensis]